jgi:hypothetical protein
MKGFDTTVVSFGNGRFYRRELPTRRIFRFGAKRRHKKKDVIVYSFADAAATMGLPLSMKSWRLAEMILTSYS